MTPEYRHQFKAGRKFRVVKAGCRLTGMQAARGGGQQGWARDLAVGEVLTCLGESMTFGDGVPAVKWADADGRHMAADCTFDLEQVVGGMWGGQLPAPGLVEPLEGAAGETH